MSMSSQPKQSNCKSCGAPIYWAKTGSGKNMPIDAKPESRFIAEWDPKTGVLSVSNRNTYVSHFSTCSQADRHRSKSSGATG